MLHLLASWTLDGNVTFSPVPGTAALLAACRLQMDKPRRCPAILESQMATAPPQATSTYPFAFLGKPLPCFKDPVAQFL